MNDIKEEKAAIPGHKYHCVFQYRSRRELDRLARFFYDHVLPKERKVSVLVSSFGLPRRVIEDILADLLRRNFAVFDPIHGEIRRMDSVRTRKTYKEGIGEITLWYDSLTGTVLPYDCVSHLTGKPVKDAVSFVDYAANATENPAAIGFDEFPDQLLINAIYKNRPELVIPHSPRGDFSDPKDDPEDWEPVSVARRRWAGAATLYLPVQEARIQLEDRTEVVPFIVDSQLRRSLTRLWSLSLLRQRNPDRSDTDAMQAAVLIAESKIESPPSLQIQSAQSDQSLKNWSRAFEQLLAEPCDSERMSYRALLESEQSLREVLLKSASESTTVEIYAPPQPQICLEAVWNRTESHLFIATNSGQEMREQLMQTVASCPGAGPDGTRRVYVYGPQMDRMEVDGTFYFRPTDSPVRELCIRDGAEAILGLTSTLFLSDPVVEVRGRLVGHIIAATRYHLDTENIFETTALDEVEADVPAAVVDIRELFDRFDTHVAACNKLARIQATDTPDAEVTQPTLADLGPLKSNLAAPISVSAIGDQVERLWRSEVAPLREFPRLISDWSLFDILLEALQLAEQRPYQSNLRIVFRDLPLVLRHVLIGFRDRMATVLGDRQSTIRMLVSPSDDRENAIEQLQLLCRDLPKNRLKFERLAHYVPDAVILDIEDGRDFVAFGTFETHQAGMPTLILESSRIASQITSWIDRT